MSHLWLSTLQTCILRKLSFGESLHYPLSTVQRSFSDEACKAVLIDEERCVPLESCLILCPCSKIIGVVSPLGFMNSPAIGFWSDSQYQTYVSYCGVGLMSNQNVVSHSQSIHFTIALMDISCQVGLVVASRVHNWIRLLTSMSLRSIFSTFQYQSSGQELPSQSLVTLCSVQKYVVSSAVRSYLRVMVNNQ